MTKPNFIFKVFFLLVVCSVPGVFAQTETKPTPADPCYEVVLQIVVASNNPAAKTSLPPSLANVVKKLKTVYAFSDYRLAATFLQRTAGSVEYKSVLNAINENQENGAPVFSEWALRNLRALPDSQGRAAIQFEVFRFAARIPVTIQNSPAETGKTSPVVNYESIGLTNTKIMLRENEPTVLGSLASSKPDETLFLVLTVKSAD
jgi:hypothetical protein